MVHTSPVKMSQPSENKADVPVQKQFESVMKSFLQAKALYNAYQKESSTAEPSTNSTATNMGLPDQQVIKEEDETFQHTPSVQGTANSASDTLCASPKHRRGFGPNTEMLNPLSQGDDPFHEGLSWKTTIPAPADMGFTENVSSPPTAVFKSPTENSNNSKHQSAKFLDNFLKRLGTTATMPYDSAPTKSYSLSSRLSEKIAVESMKVTLSREEDSNVAGSTQNLDDPKTVDEEAPPAFMLQGLQQSTSTTEQSHKRSLSMTKDTRPEMESTQQDEVMQRDQAIIPVHNPTAAITSESQHPGLVRLLKGHKSSSEGVSIRAGNISPPHRPITHASKTDLANTPFVKKHTGEDNPQNSSHNIIQKLLPAASTDEITVKPETLSYPEDMAAIESNPGATHKQDPVSENETATASVFIPMRLVKYLQESGITGSSERDANKGNRRINKHSRGFHIEDLVLESSQEESPVITFVNKVSDIKAKARQSYETQDPAIVTGANFDYELPPWVAPCHGRLYVWHFAKNLRLGKNPLAEEAYKEIFNNYDRNGKTDLEIEADEAFIRGEWDVIAEMRKPKNRDAILEYERQPGRSSEDIPFRSYVYEDYILPKKFTLRMIKCKPRTMLQHEISHHNRKYDLPPRDEIRLDVDVFVSLDDELEIKPFDIIKGRYPEVAIPLHPLWQSAADLELMRQGKKIITPTNFNTGRQWKNDLVVGAESDYGEQRHDDLHWADKIQHPKTEADLTAHGCFLYMNPDNVENLSSWLDDVVNLALQDPCQIDVNTDEFRSAQYPTTGLARPYFPYPQELLTDELYAPPQQAPNFDQIDYPEDQGFDPIQSHDDHMPWKFRDSSNSACRQYFTFLARQYKLLQERRTLQRAEKKRALKEAMEYEPVPYKPIHLDPFRPNRDSLIKPGLAMYVRPATHDDMDTLLSIHKYWATETNSTPDPSHATLEHITNILSTTTDTSLPFFVACLNKTPRTKRQTHGTRIHKEQVIGTAYALPWSPLSTFHSTYETFIYTSPDPSHQGNSIATTLLDRLLTALDLDHTPQFPTPCFDNGIPAPTFESGGMRGTVPARKLLANIYYTDAETHDMFWKRDWLKKWGWRENAMTSDIGRAPRDGADSLHLLCMGYDVGWRRERGRGMLCYVML